MTLRISGKSISVGEALRGRIGERTEEVLRKYFDGNFSGHITLSKDGFSFQKSDFRENDQMHHSEAGMKKMGTELLRFFKTNQTTQTWFDKQIP